MVDRTVRARVRYLDPAWRDRDEVPRIGSRASRRAATSYREVTIHDARAAAADLGLERSGFELCEQPDRPIGDAGSDTRRAYREAMLDLVRRVSGAVDTHLLADLVRTEDQSDFNTAYARFVHCDYNVANLDAMSRRLLARRGVAERPGTTYAWYNTWQPFDHPVHQHALALLDVRSLAPGDVIDYRYTGYDGGEGGLVSAPVYRPDHRWWYYPDMTTREVLVTKQLDARPGRTRQCPHTSFVDESRPDGRPPRRSIETRILAVFDVDAEPDAGDATTPSPAVERRAAT